MPPDSNSTTVGNGRLLADISAIGRGLNELSKIQHHVMYFDSCGQLTDITPSTGKHACACACSLHAHVLAHVPARVHANVQAHVLANMPAHVQARVRAQGLAEAPDALAASREWMASSNRMRIPQ